MIDVRRSADRYPGGDPPTGISSRHSFSFGPHYDPDNLRFGALIACNEEQLPPGAGFDEHPHRHTEIVTWVISGELTHRDSAGHTSRVRAGDLQHLSAAGGVRHIERNDGPEPLVFLQMWLAPLDPGGTPRYEVVRGIADATPYALPEAGALLHVRRAGPGERLALSAPDHAYVHVVRGELALGDPEAGGTSRLGPGDSARLTREPDAEGRALTPVEVLVWEMRDTSAPR